MLRLLPAGEGGVGQKIYAGDASQVLPDCHSGKSRLAARLNAGK